MATRHATLVVMAKMALSDGTVTEEEREFLTPMLDSGESVDDLLEEAKKTPLKALVKSIEKYADRFFIALRAASMAMIDADLDASEEALYEALVRELEITEEDQQIISRNVDALASKIPLPIDPRIEELFSESSFN